MRFFYESHEPQTTDQYVSDLTRRLQSNLPRDKAEQIADEAHAHLSDRVDDLMDTGLNRTQAEATALAGFGSSRAYARAAVGSAYGDRNMAAWRLVGRVAVANFLAFNVVHILYPTNQMASFTVAPALGCFALTVLSALASRRPQTKEILAMSAVSLLAVGAVAGARYVPNRDTRAVEIAHLSSPAQSLHGGPGLVRDDYTEAIKQKRHRLRMLSQETGLLRQGMTTYAQGLPVADSLRINGRFIVPLPFDTSWNTTRGIADKSAFKNYPIYDDTLADHELAFSRIPYQAVATRQEAERLWAERSPLWLAGKQRLVDYHTDEIATYSRALTAPAEFNWGAATYHVSASLWLCAILVLVDFLLAYLGRVAWIQTRNFRRQTAR